MHGHFTLKQLRLPVLNETHTNSYTGPRLMKIEASHAFYNLVKYAHEIEINSYIFKLDPSRSGFHEGSSHFGL